MYPLCAGSRHVHQRSGQPQVFTCFLFVCQKTSKLLWETQKFLTVQNCIKRQSSLVLTKYMLTFEFKESYTKEKISKKCFCYIFWHFPNRNIFCNSTCPETREVWWDLSSDSEKKKKFVLFYLAYLNIWFQLYVVVCRHLIFSKKVS